MTAPDIPKQENPKPERSGPSRGEYPATIKSILARKIWLARAAIFWERFWPALGPAAAVIALFLIAALFDIWSFYPAWVHGLGLAALGASLLYLLWREFRHFRLPRHDEGQRRLEVASGFDHRPLATLDDEPVGNRNDIIMALWRAHVARSISRVRNIQVGLPEAGWARRDRFGIRVPLGLLLVAAIASAGPSLRDLLAIGMDPGAGSEERSALYLDVWVTPPAYTGLAPQFLTRDGRPITDRPGVAQGAAIRVPVKSELTARVHGGGRTPSMRFGKEEIDLGPVDARNHQGARVIETAGTLAIRRGTRTLGEWALDVIPDLPPEAHFVEKPKASNRAALEIAFGASDDYGVARVALEMRRLDEDGVKTGEPLVIDLPLPVQGTKKAEERSFQDLTSHPWAGLKVHGRVIAYDGAGQSGASEEMEFTIPERRFTHPVARALVEQRRKLLIDPVTRDKVKTALEVMTAAPELYQGDTSTHLGLRAAIERMRLDKTAKQLPDIAQMLWDIALHLEDGSLSPAERDLRAAQQALQDALARNAPDEEIEKLMRELREAMDRYMQAMLEDAMRRAEAGEEPPEMDPDQDYVEMDDLRDMMDQAEELARQGARDAAREMLSELQRMLEGMKGARIAKAPPGQQGKPQRGQRGQRGGQPGGEAMRELGDLMRRQQDLMDRSFRQGRDGKPGNPGDAREQDNLRRQLGDMMRKFSDRGMPVPGALQRAERFMRDAGDALSRGEPGNATQPQGDALDALRQGGQELAQQLNEQEMNRGDQADARRQGKNERNQLDPLGRPLGGQWDDGRQTRVPTELESQRTREIMEELQRRSGDRRRPQLERDYIERLLRRF